MPPSADDIALVLKAQSNTGLGNGLMEVLYDPTPGADVPVDRCPPRNQDHVLVAAESGRPRSASISRN